MYTPTSPEIVQELWFSDATVVFQAGAKLFRVHRGLLSAKSSVLKDRFYMPNPPNAPKGDYGDDCTYIYLPDDATDVYYFFMAIFHAEFFEPPPSTPAIYIIISILRLADKYDVVFLKRRAVAHLNVLFPTDWETFWNMYKSKLIANPRVKDENMPDHDIFPLLKLCPIVGVRWILPAVHFILSFYPLSALFQFRGWGELPAWMQQKYLIHREDCLREQLVHGSWVLAQPTCWSMTRCSEALQRLHRRGLLKFGHVLTGTTLLSDFDDSFCGGCRKDAQRKAANAGQEHWNELPTYLDLGEWSLLNIMKSRFSKM